MTTVFFAVNVIFNLLFDQDSVITYDKRRSLFIITLIFMAMACVGIASAAVTDTYNDNMIHVTGTDTVIGSPDRAQVTFSVETENPNVKAAQQDNAKKMAKVIDALVAIVIPRDARKTTDYNIYPAYEYT